MRLTALTPPPPMPTTLIRSMVVRRCHAALPNWTLILKFSLTVMSTSSDLDEVRCGERGQINTLRGRACRWDRIAPNTGDPVVTSAPLAVTTRLGNVSCRGPDPACPGEERELRKLMLRVGRAWSGRVDDRRGGERSAAASVTEGDEPPGRRAVRGFPHALGGLHNPGERAEGPESGRSAQDDVLGRAHIDRRRRVQLLAGYLLEHCRECGCPCDRTAPGHPSAPACRRSRVSVMSSAAGTATDVTRLSADPSTWPRPRPAPPWWPRHRARARPRRGARRLGGGRAGDRVEQHAVGVHQGPLTRSADDRDRHPFGHGHHDGVRPATGDRDRRDLGQSGEPAPGRRPRRPAAAACPVRCRRSPAPGRRAAR